MRTPLKPLTNVGICVLLVTLGVIGSAAQVQADKTTTASQETMRFETVSIRPHKASGANEPSNRQMLPGGRFIATNVPVRTLIRIVFRTDDALLTGGPGWIREDTFDINGITENHADVKTLEQFQQLLLSMLEDQFQLKYHKVQKEVPVFWLEVVKPGRLGPALKTAMPDTRPTMSTNRLGNTNDMKVTNSSMNDIAGGLLRQAGRPVENHTGVAGNYDFEIRWSPDDAADATEPRLTTVLKEQLGLKLLPAKGTLETIAIDSISKPSPN